MRAVSRSIVIAVALVGVLTQAGCGGGSDTASGPASVASDSVPIYVEAAIRPEGDLKSTLESLAQRILPPGVDPATAIQSQVDAVLQGNGAELTYASDIAPWLGDKAGLSISSVPGTTTTATPPDYVLAIETTDEDATKAALDKLTAATPQGVSTQSYKGVDYVSVEGQQSAYTLGIDNGLLIFTPNPADFQGAIDAVQSGHSLADSDQFTSSLDTLPDERVATAYVDLGAVIDAQVAAGGTPEQDAASARSLFGGLLDQPIVAALTASSDNIGLELSSGEVPGISAQSSALLQGAPSDSWLAASLPDLGSTLSQSIDNIESLGAALGEPQLKPGAIGDAFSAATGLDLQETLAAIGDAAVFVRGTSLAQIDVGAKIETTNDAAATKLIDALRAAAERQNASQVGPPLDSGAVGFSAIPNDSSDFHFLNIQLADGSVEVSLAADRAAAQAPSGTLDSDPDFQAAQGGLGEGFGQSFYLNVPTALQLAASTGATRDPRYVSARPIFEALRYLVGGARGEGDKVITRIALGFNSP